MEPHREGRVRCQGSRSWYGRAALFLAVGFSGACGRAATTAGVAAPAAPAPAAEGVRRARAAWNAAAARRDTAAVGRLVAESVTVVSPYTRVVGRAAYLRELAGILARSDGATLRYEPGADATEVEVARVLGRTVAAERGRWETTWRRRGEPVALGGSYYVTWEQRAGAWVMVSESFIPTFCRGVGFCER